MTTYKSTTNTTEAVSTTRQEPVEIDITMTTITHNLDTTDVTEQGNWEDCDTL